MIRLRDPFRQFETAALILGNVRRALRAMGGRLAALAEAFTLIDWTGAIFMAIGGGLSLSDRRFRIAAGARKTPARSVPAE